jgi:hypothetical protein
MADETVKETKAPEMAEEEIVGQLPDMQLAQLRFELGCSDSVCTNKAELKQQLVDAVTKDSECYNCRLFCHRWPDPRTLLQTRPRFTRACALSLGGVLMRRL